MSILYTLSKSPTHKQLDSCSRYLDNGDALLFIQDGVYHCVDENLLANLDSKFPLYALKEDIAARGLGDKILESLEPVSYRKFVELCTQYDKVVSWF